MKKNEIEITQRLQRHTINLANQQVNLKMRVGPVGKKGGVDIIDFFLKVRFTCGQTEEKTHG